MIIKDEFKPSYGEPVKIRNVNFESLDDFHKYAGGIIADSHRDDTSNFELNEDGVYICRCKYDFTKALRVYKDLSLYKYTSHSDYKLISRLQEKQSNIKLSEFPTGILTIENFIVGQEIPFYDNSETLYDHLQNGNMKKRPTQLYLEILKILKELCENGIIYTDVHRRNFMVNKMSEIVNIIDFDASFVSFDSFRCTYMAMLNNLKRCIVSGFNSIEGCELSYEFDDEINEVFTLEEVEQLLIKIDNKLKIK